MTLRLLDSVAALDQRGVLLFSMDEENAPLVSANVRLTDALHQTHIVTAASEQDGLYTFHLAHGDAAYFERLFRNIRVDATLFTFEPEIVPPCQ